MNSPGDDDDLIPEDVYVGVFQVMDPNPVDTAGLRHGGFLLR